MSLLIGGLRLSLLAAGLPASSTPTVPTTAITDESGDTLLDETGDYILEG